MTAATVRRDILLVMRPTLFEKSISERSAKILDVCLIAFLEKQH